MRQQLAGFVPNIYEKCGLSRGKTGKINWYQYMTTQSHQHRHG